MRFDGVKWVWFDLDDTLIDFHANSRLAHRIIYRDAGLDRYYPTPEEWIEVYEAHNKTLWDRYSRAEITQDFLRFDRFATPLGIRWHGSREELERLSKRLDVEYLDRLAEQTVMIDGAVGLLAHLRAHYNIGVLSNGFKDVQYRQLENTGLAPLVDLVVLSDDIGINKPDPRIFAYAMEQSGSAGPESHLMVGDNLSTDISGAVAAGWRAVHFDRRADVKNEDGKYLTISDLRLLERLL